MIMQMESIWKKNCIFEGIQIYLVISVGTEMKSVIQFVQTSDCTADDDGDTLEHVKEIFIN